jgi:protein-S-isoprenylcysteine O-methyltransferase Ste14
MHTAKLEFTPPAPPAAAPSLRASFCYRRRSVITAGTLFAGWLLAAFSEPRIAEGSWLDIGIDLLAWLCFLAGAGVRLWATLFIGGRKARGVVCEGPYSLCRNPLYVGTFLVVLSQAVFFHSLTFGLLLILPVLVYTQGVVPAEEAYLSQKIGDEYREYCARVPRWRLQWRGFTSPATVELDLKGLLVECRRIAGWMAVPLLAEAACLLRMQPWWPHLFNLP